MSRHRAPRPRYYWWQLRREVAYQLHNLKLWINEQVTDLHDIRAELKEKKK